jgi:hypothetical protein
LNSVFYHRYRGEEEQARAFEQEFLRFSADTGAGWALTAQLRWFSLLAYCLTSDFMALRYMNDKLESLVENDGLEGLTPFMFLGRGFTSLHQGRSQESETIFNGLLRMPLIQENIILKQIVLVGLSRAMLAHEAKKEAALVAGLAKSCALIPRAWWGSITVYVICQLAIIEGILQGPGRAIKLMNQFRLHANSNPLLLGSFHEARAVVAMLLGDAEEACRQWQLTEQWFSMTHNPTLLERAKALGKEIQGVPTPLHDKFWDERQEEINSQGPLSRLENGERLSQRKTVNISPSNLSTDRTVVALAPETLFFSGGD